ncbi:ABC transporter ATP-binding protein [Labilibacter marinus]|uniref:ABC transporter ATP-binding protein n=1 Tax=Labilibacter marinus TaxID=1477105 RepID=UPI00082A4D6B|nr:ABC transporter ATP-binding protein [Labilibacter marinus]
MITLYHTVKKYGENTVLDIDTLTINKGEIFGLVGNNGAGKTTMFSAILDLVRLSDGYIENNQTKVNESEDWKMYTSAYLDEKFLIGYLTPKEYFEMIGKLKNISPDEVQTFIGQFEEFFNGELDGKQKYIRSLSKGNQQKIGVIGALIGKPQIVILDEPFSNLDPTSQYRLRHILRDFSKENNSSVLISSHDLNHVAELCNRIVILEKGKVIDDVITSDETMGKLEDYFAV